MERQICMKKKIRPLSARQIILIISGAVSFLIFLGLCVAIGILGNSQLSQKMASRWSEKKDAAQISCFFSVDAGVSEDTIEMFRHSVDGALQEASVTQESPNAGARLWTDAYSADGRIVISSDKGSLEANAVGIGGDFFQFHPLTLLYGSYFSGNDLNLDYCVIDEDAAWQLFGSNDVAGMTVYIQNIPHIISGVVRREGGRLAKMAGLESTVVYVSYDTLENYGASNGINHYEIVMPNPVSRFAYNYVKENIGINEKAMEVVENSGRFNLIERLKLILEFGTRSMNGKAIIYPYWENVARGYEDILSLLTLISLIFLLYPTVLMLVWLSVWWKHKTWTVKSVYLHVKDKSERGMEKLRARRKSKDSPLEFTDGSELTGNTDSTGRKGRKPRGKFRLKLRHRSGKKKDIAEFIEDFDENEL